jgi:hypothetical protein
MTLLKLRLGINQDGSEGHLLKTLIYPMLKVLELYFAQCFYRQNFVIGDFKQKHKSNHRLGSHV